MPVRHRTVDELWFVTEGHGEMWLLGPGEVSAEPAPIGPGSSLSIPVGTTFQFRNTGSVPLFAVGVTMPPWPGQRGGRTARRRAVGAHGRARSRLTRARGSGARQPPSVRPSRHFA